MRLLELGMGMFQLQLCSPHQTDADALLDPAQLRERNMTPVRDLARTIERRFAFEAEPVWLAACPPEMSRVFSRGRL